MRITRIALAMAVALMALGAFSAQAFAKEKLVFGEFEGSVTGQNLETTEVPVQVWKEDKELEVEELQLGNYKFYTKSVKTGGKEFGNPCLKSPVIKGHFKADPGKVNKSASLPLDITFKKCISHAGEGGVTEGKPVTFTLPVKLEQNFSAEAGPKIAGAEIGKTVITFKGALRKCPVVVPQQTIPFNDNPEHEYEEIVSYSNELPEAVENWEHSKKKQAEYPSGFKNRLEVEFEEKFKGIHTFVKATPPCEPAKGEDNPKLIEEGPEGPYHGEYNGWLEYSSGKIFMDIEGLEIPGGELGFH